MLFYYKMLWSRHLLYLMLLITPLTLSHVMITPSTLSHVMITPLTLSHVMITPPTLSHVMITPLTLSSPPRCMSMQVPPACESASTQVLGRGGGRMYNVYGRMYNKYEGRWVCIMCMRGGGVFIMYMGGMGVCIMYIDSCINALYVYMNIVYYRSHSRRFWGDLEYAEGEV